MDDFRWIDDHMPNTNDFYNAWSFDLNQNTSNLSSNNLCVTIDPRGITHNLMQRKCDDDVTLTFICEFLTIPKFCSENNTYVYNKTGIFKDNPPLDSCRAEEAAYHETLYMEEVKDITSEQAICPVGKLDPNWYEYSCCFDEGDKVETWILVVVIVAASVGLVLLLYTVLVVLDYFALINLHQCCNVCVLCRRYWCGGRQPKASPA